MIQCEKRRTREGYWYGTDGASQRQIARSFRSSPTAISKHADAVVFSKHVELKTDQDSEGPTERQALNCTQDVNPCSGDDVMIWKADWPKI
ncbi:hypothetical protein SNE40_014097 [Patella caerulea]|uniref:Uncharacterized protein n=1 Tax=Patella caerulea TaxID=87958 RepID=A0AAN8JCY4_PATCE